MRALMALAFLASVAGCEQPEGAPTTNGGQNLAGSQVADGTWGNVSDDPGASAPETGADPGANEASPASDPGDPIAGEDVLPVTDPCLGVGDVYFTPELGYELYVDKKSMGDECQLTLTGSGIGGETLVLEGDDSSFEFQGTLALVKLDVVEKTEAGVASRLALRRYWNSTGEMIYEGYFVVAPPD